MLQLTDEGGVYYLSEFLNNLPVSGLSIHTKALKVDVPIILMRNLKLPQLCNGTQLKITSLKEHVIEATILIGL